MEGPKRSTKKDFVDERIAIHAALGSVRFKVEASRPSDRQSISLHPTFYDFHIGPFRLKGTGKEWRELEKEAELAHISLDHFRPFLSRPRRDLLGKLQDYAQRDPESFSREVYRDAKGASVMCVPEPRGGSPYPYPPAEMRKIRTLSRHLYIWLQYWLRKARDKRPGELQLLLERLRMSRYSAKKITKTITHRVMKAHFPYLGNNSGSYYRHFIIGGRGLAAVKVYHKAKGYRITTTIPPSMDGTKTTIADLLKLPI